jgi:hypothetical protein
MSQKIPLMSWHTSCYILGAGATSAPAGARPTRATRGDDRRKEVTMTKQSTTPPTETPIASTNDAAFWCAHGTTIDRVKALRVGSAAEIRSAWDYRAEGLTIDSARTLLGAHVRAGAWRCGPIHPAANVAAADAARAAIAEGHRDWRNSESSLPVLNREANAGRILAALAHRRQLRADRAAMIAACESPAAWLSTSLTWEHSWIGLVLPDGRILRTDRHESVTWDSRGKHHWPDSRTTSYRSRLLPADPCSGVGNFGPESYHDQRGDWRSRVLVALGLVTEAQIRDRADFAARLHPACTVNAGHALPDGTRIRERSLLGVRVDTVAQSPDGTCFHGPSAAAAVAGLARKLRHAAAAARGELLSAGVAETRWGFCRDGLAEFAEAAGIDLDGEYTVEEIKAVVTPEIRNRFERDLALAGI